MRHRFCKQREKKRWIEVSAFGEYNLSSNKKALETFMLQSIFSIQRCPLFNQTLASKLAKQRCVCGGTSYQYWAKYRERELNNSTGFISEPIEAAQDLARHALLCYSRSTKCKYDTFARSAKGRFWVSRLKNNETETAVVCGSGLDKKKLAIFWPPFTRTCKYAWRKVINNYQVNNRCPRASFSLNVLFFVVALMTRYHHLSSIKAALPFL